MLDYLRKNPLVKFLLIAFSLYLIWYVFYLLVLKPYTSLDRDLSVILVHSADFILSTLGYTPVTNTEYVDVTIKLHDSPTPGVWVGDNCNGVSLFSLFLIYIIAFPGPTLKKLWYIPLGVLTIHLINTIRVAALTVIERDALETLDFNHTYTFTIVVYAFVFFLWYYWTSKLSGIQNILNTENKQA